VPIFSEILDVVAPTREGWMLILVFEPISSCSGADFQAVHENLMEGFG
jgi:hypothetical protein